MDPLTLLLALLIVVVGLVVIGLLLNKITWERGVILILVAAVVVAIIYALFSVV